MTCIKCGDMDDGAQGWANLRKMVIFDWYDGPTSGIMVCDKCGTAYSFFMLEWDNDHEVRVFALGELCEGSLVKVIACLDEEPQWPVWFPKKMTFPTEEFRERLGIIERLMLDARAPTIVLAWHRTARHVMAARRLREDLMPKVRSWFESDDNCALYDWFAYLEIARG